MNLHTVSQLLEENDLSIQLATDENETLIEELTAFPVLQYKLAFWFAYSSRPYQVGVLFFL
jgi:hypothetical protein